MDWLINHWAQILIGLGLFCAIGFAIKKYTDSTETRRDDWLGNFLGWIAGLIRAILGVVSKGNGKKLCIIILLLFLPILYSGCAAMNQQSAVAQISLQTNDPIYIAKATYLDALRAYNTARDTYLSVKNAVEITHPELADQIIADFHKANDLLDAWKAAGLITASDKTELFNLLSRLSLKVAMKLEE